MGNQTRGYISPPHIDYLIIATERCRHCYHRSRLVWVEECCLEKL